MGSNKNIDKRSKQTQVLYDLVGAQVDIGQFIRAYLRYEKGGQESNLEQLITKLEEARKDLFSKDQ